MGHTLLGFSAPGALDQTFNPGSGANITVRAIALSTNGSVLIGGSFSVVNGIARSRIARLGPDGTLDPSFDPGQGPGDQVYAIVPLPDGKAVIAGNFTAINDILRGYVARLRADASVDLSFQDPQFNGTVRQLTALSNSQYLAVGLFTSAGAIARRNVAKLNGNGTLDLAFNPAVGVTNFSSVLAALVQPDGMVILAGDFPVINGTAHNLIARVFPNGTVDSSFDAGVIGGSSISQLLLQPDGKILIAGSFSSIDGYSRIGLARLNTNGTVDTSFVLPNGLNGVTSMGLQSDGKILLAGNFGYTAPPPASFSQNYLLRLDTTGTADSSLRTVISGSLATAALQSDGRILIGGFFQSVGGTNINCIARLLNDATTTGAVSQVAITLHAGITIAGTAGNQYRIESTTNLNTPMLWTPVTNLTLNGNSGTTYDPLPASRRQTYYRAVLIP